MSDSDPVNPESSPAGPAPDAGSKSASQPLTPEAELGSRVTRALGSSFDVDREVGRGGMGIVYHATDRRLKRAVAVKVLPPDLAFRADIRTRFLHEAETAAQLTHPNIVPIYSVDEREGLVYFVMAFVDGQTLGQRIKAAAGPMSIAESRGVLRQVASALAYAHAHGVIHRDIKPDNILLAKDGDRVMVTDFGIARAVTAGTDSRLTATGVVVGTPTYMSPEQCAGDKQVDGRSDLYSLGVLAYQMLSGTLPFTGTSTAAILVKQLSEAPPQLSQRAPWVPPALAAATMRLLAKNPDQRFPDASAFISALDAPDSSPAAANATGTPVRERSEGQPPVAGPLPPGTQSLFAPPPPPAAPSMPFQYGAPAGSLPLGMPASVARLNEEARSAAFAISDQAMGLSRAQLKALKRARKERDDDIEIEPWDPRQRKIRRFRGALVSMGGTMLFLSALSIVTSPHEFWAIYPDLGLGLGLFMAYGRLWRDHISLREVFSPPRPAPTFARMPGPSGAPTPETVASASSLASAAVLAGPFGAVVRQAALDRDRIHDIVASLDRRDRDQVPNAEATAKGLAGQVGALASALHRIDVDTPPAQRSAVATHRAELASQLDRASIMLQTLYLDLVRFRVSNASSGADGVAGVTEQASALSRDIGYLLGAADELRALDGRPRD